MLQSGLMLFCIAYTLMLRPVRLSKRTEQLCSQVVDSEVRLKEALDRIDDRTVTFTLQRSMSACKHRRSSR
jgi:hypothetical protein